MYPSPNISVLILTTLLPQSFKILYDNPPYFLGFIFAIEFSGVNVVFL